MIFENGIYNLAEVQRDLGLSEDDLVRVLKAGLLTRSFGKQIVVSGRDVLELYNKGGASPLDEKVSKPAGYKGRKVGKSGKLE